MHHLSDFNFNLPEKLIATSPLANRDDSKLLYIPKSGTLVDDAVKNLANYLREGDVLVFNNTKVFPAYLVGKKGEANIKINLLNDFILPNKNSEENSENNDDFFLINSFCKPAKKLKVKDEIFFASDFVGIVEDKKENGEVILKFPYKSSDFWEKLTKYGNPPLPPYILKKREINESDKENYQTIYAEKSGSVAAPTAGLHFTDELFKKLEEKGIKKTFVTLHVGAGTFLPVKTENLNEHKMHFEWCEISEESAEIINNAKANGGRIIAVGTTSLRTLESMATPSGFPDLIRDPEIKKLDPGFNPGIQNPGTKNQFKIKSGSCSTDIFILPGYKFKIIDALFTNFHLPKSTLFMLVSAIAGRKKMQNAYKHAIDNDYRFFSYGDASLIEIDENSV
jgi:S-adenosylmethionine:tRNA ribosyltransferase-isomerase